MDTTVCIVAGVLVIILAILFVAWPRWIAKNDPPATGPIDNAVKQTSRGLMEGSIGMGILCIAIWGFSEVIPAASWTELIIFGFVTAGALAMIFCRRE